MANNNFELIPKGDYFEDKYSGILYIESNGNYYPLMDPFMHGKLIPQQDGTFMSEYIGKTFTFDKTRNTFIPNYIPSFNGSEMEDAHIEGDYLVGNTSQQKYLIDSHGRILTDENVEFINKNRESQDQAAWKIEYNINNVDEEQDLDTYYNRVNSLLSESEQPLSICIIVRDSKCYFSVHSSDGTSTLLANIFTFDDDFYSDFLLPLLKSDINQEFMDQSYVVYQGNEDSRNMAFKTNNNSTILISGITDEFVERLQSSLTNKNVK